MARDRMRNSPARKRNQEKLQDRARQQTEVFRKLWDQAKSEAKAQSK
jgi:hypothetical protein